LTAKLLYNAESIIGIVPIIKSEVIKNWSIIVDYFPHIQIWLINFFLIYDLRGGYWSEGPNLIEVNRFFSISNSIIVTSFIHFFIYSFIISILLCRIHLSLSNILHLLQDRIPTARHNYCFVYHSESSLNDDEIIYTSFAEWYIINLFEAFNLNFINSVLFMRVYI